MVKFIKKRIINFIITKQQLQSHIEFLDKLILSTSHSIENSNNIIQELDGLIKDMQDIPNIETESLIQISRDRKEQVKKKYYL